MKSSVFIFSALVCLTITASCHKPKPFQPGCKEPQICILPSADTLEMYRSGGWTGSVHGLIVNGAAYKDSTYDKNIWQQLSNEKYQKVAGLLNYIPGELYNSDSALYGSNEGTADIPTTMVIAKRYGKTYKWTFEYNAPKQFEQFISEVNEALDEIQFK